MFEFSRHWATVSLTSEERARIPVVVASRYRAILLWNIRANQQFPNYYFFFYMAIAWKPNLSMAENELELYFLPVSKLCNSESTVSDHLPFPHQQIKLPLSYLVAHVSVIDCGHSSHRPSDAFLPAWVPFAPSRSCISSAASPSSASHLNLPPVSHGLCPDTALLSSLPLQPVPSLGEQFFWVAPDQQQGP